MIPRISIALLVIALLALAGLQYHWIGEISVAERQRLEVSVRESSNRFAGDFASEIRSLTNAMDMRGGEPNASAIALRYRSWEETAANPELLKALYLVRSEPREAPQLSQVDLQEERLLSLDWPHDWIPLKMYFQRDPTNGTQPLLPRLEGATALLIQTGSGRPSEPPRGLGGPGPNRGFGGGPGGGAGARPEFPPEQRFPRGFQPAPVRADSWLVAILDESVFSKQVFPALVARDFPVSGDQNYRIAVVSMNPVSRTVFSSDKSWSVEELATPDYAVDLLGPPGQFTQLGGGVRGGGRQGGRGTGPGVGGPGGGLRGGPIPALYYGPPLRLLVKHESGSLEAAVSNLRRRNLAISFGILMVLALGAGVVIVSGQRARTLGRLQMEFAAGVSHELRTPLAVIQSAAHNLRAGVVRDREGIEEYAAIVQKEARRLSGMVEQVMTYAETQSGRKRYDIGPIDLNRVVDGVLQSMAMPLTDANAAVENRIDPQLPPAMGDEAAVSQCVQNLLNNALKYGNASESVQIEIESELDREAGKIRLSVIDHGPGVPLVDERHLFDPFHRGSNAATNTPGNGLGLHLVRRIMESQNGTVTYKRADHGGARFTLTLPVAEATA